MMNCLLKVGTVTIIITLITFVELKKITVETKPDGTKVCRELCDNPNLNECPEVKCPEEKKNENESKPTVDHDRSCPPPDCLDEEQTTKLYPASDDPAAFYQCPAYGPWEPMESECGCQTVFSFELQRCVHPFEWKKECDEHPDRPTTHECVVVAED